MLDLASGSFRRRLALLLLSTALITNAIAGTAVAKGVDSVFFPDPFDGGWYPGPVSGQFVFDVDPNPIVPSQGAYIERITNISCTGASFSHPSLPREADTQVIVQTLGSSSSSSGTAVACTATYQRSLAECTNVFGVVICGSFGPFFPAGTETASVTLKIDTTPPTNVTAQPSAPANANGWYRTAGTVSWAGQDTLSGIYDCDTGEPFGGTDTAAGVAGGGCRNNAGLRTNAPFNYKFDGTAPSLAPTVSPSTIALNGSATASPNASDNLSGIDTASCDPVDTSSAGAHSVSCSATDMAGNTTTESVSYTVVGYTFTGFAAPVDNGAVNLAKAGRAIPLKWRATDADGHPVTNISSVSVKATGVACDIGETVDLVEEYAPGSSGLQNLGGGYYQFNWSTPKSYAGSCKVLRLDLGDGIEHTADFRFEK